MGGGVHAGTAQEVRERAGIGQGMPSGLRRPGSRQVVIQVGKHGARNMRRGELLLPPVRTCQIVATIHDHSRCSVGRERRGQVSSFNQVQWQFQDSFSDAVLRPTCRYNHPDSLVNQVYGD